MTAMRMGAPPQGTYNYSFGKNKVTSTTKDTPSDARKIGLEGSGNGDGIGVSAASEIFHRSRGGRHTNACESPSNCCPRGREICGNDRESGVYAPYVRERAQTLGSRHVLGSDKNISMQVNAIQGRSVMSSEHSKGGGAEYNIRSKGGGAGHNICSKGGGTEHNIYSKGGGHHPKAEEMSSKGGDNVMCRVENRRLGIGERRQRHGGERTRGKCRITIHGIEFGTRDSNTINLAVVAEERARRTLEVGGTWDD
ncbi:hypothetical protein BDZ89DRAFT_1186876 [Hymenopellis radicata]|nr:hypothetical protein BDZ89DRAFT_1186876 [Hymenopellis radicata]